MRLSVFGLGYVGTVSAGCLAASGHEVVGVDVSPDKVACIGDGRSPIVEPEIEDVIRDAVGRGRLRATTSAREAVAASDVSLVCVGTPSLRNGSLDLSHVERVCEEIGEAIARKETPHLVILRSTMLPGGTEQVAIPRLEAAAGRVVGTGLGVCYNPEFLREGCSVRDYYNPPKIVIGELDKASGDAVVEMYSTIPAPIFRTSIRVAEAVKYVDNAFHALKVSFANEIGNVCRGLGVNGHEVMSLFCRDTKLNLSPAYLKPGFAFGGSCLPKDLRALTYRARQLDVETPVLSAVLESNARQVELGFAALTRLNRKQVGFVGMSFKPDSDDLRESPLVTLIESLVGKGYAVRVFDRSVSMNRLVGANRRYVDEHLPHLSSLLVESLDELVERSEVIVLGHASRDGVVAALAARPDQTVVDLVGIARDLAISGRYEGLC